MTYTAAEARTPSLRADVARPCGRGPPSPAHPAPRPSAVRPTAPTTRFHMSTRTFTISELLALSIPPDSPKDVEYLDDVHVDEHVSNLKYTQLRRCVFDAPDGHTYAVEYEAPMDVGDFELGNVGPDNYGWYGPVEAVQVERRLTGVEKWMPVADDGEVRLPGQLSCREHLAEVYIESGCRDDVARMSTYDLLADHTRELADFLRERHPQAALALDGHARDLAAKAEEA